MNERPTLTEFPDGYLSEKNIDHSSLPFKRLQELHSALWGFVRIALPGAGGHLDDYVGPAFDELSRLRAEVTTLRAHLKDKEVRKFSVSMPDGRTALAVNEIVQEMLEATKEHGALASPHEGLGVLLEEFEELKDWVKLKEEKRDPLAGRREAKQVAAVALRFMLDCCEQKEKGGMITKPVAAIIGESGCARAVCVLLLGIVLTVSGCAAPSRSYLSVTDQTGKEVLTVQDNGKFRWKAKRDEVARVMLGLLIKKDELLKKLQQDLTTCKTPAKPAKAKK